MPCLFYIYIYMCVFRAAAANRGYGYEEVIEEVKNEKKWKSGKE